MGNSYNRRIDRVTWRFYQRYGSLSYSITNITKKERTMKNWKTTVGGIMLSVGTLLAAGEGAYSVIGIVMASLGGLLVGTLAIEKESK